MNEHSIINIYLWFYAYPLFYLIDVFLIVMLFLRRDKVQAFNGILIIGLT